MTIETGDLIAVRTLNYAQARSLIQDGDTIAVRETHGFLTPFTRFFTGSPVTHIGGALWLDGGLWMDEMNSGKNHLIPMSQLSETDFDVYECPVDRVRARAAALDALRLKLAYSFVVLPVIGLLNWLHIKAFVHWRRLLVCSGYRVAVYEAAGWPERSRVISPRELAAMLKLKLEVRPIKPASAGFSL